MRGTVLSTVRTLLKAELRDAQQTNTAADLEYNYALANKQTDFALAYDWPFLEHKWDLACPAGSRYLNIPTADTRGLACTINFERPLKVSRYFSLVYTELDYKIDLSEYTYQNSDLDQRLDPVQKWQLVSNPNETANPNQVEVWPIPATNITIRFVGQRNVQALAADTDKADLDDLLLAYFVAADYLLMRQQPNATLMLKKAQEHLVRLRAGYPAKDIPPTIIGGRTQYNRKQIRLIPAVIVA